MYHRDNAVTQGPTFSIRQVNDIMVSAADSSDRQAVLQGSINTFTFTVSSKPTSLFYATDIEQT
jgi:hypothetical protein